MRFQLEESLWPLFIKTQLHSWLGYQAFSITRYPACHIYNYPAGYPVHPCGAYEKDGEIIKGKGRRVCLGGIQNFVQFLAALTVMPRSVWKKRLNSSYSSKTTQAKQLARQGIE